MRPRRTRTDLISLTALCAVVFGFGMTSGALWTPDESVMALAARRMQTTDIAVVPIVAGGPALDVPPLLPWAQVGLAKALSWQAGEMTLHLCVGIGAWLGVIATYLVARRLLDDPGGDARHRAFANRAAWWSALMLLASFLFVRAARVGEPQILLVAPTVVGIGALHAAWRSHMRRQRISFGAVGLAMACASLCTLAIGPAGMIAMIVGGYAGIIIAQLSGKERVGGRGGGLIKALTRTSPLLVIIVPLFVLWLWSRTVAIQTGSTSAFHTLTVESFAGALTIGAVGRLAVHLVVGGGLASLAFVLGVMWFVQARPRLPAGWLFIAAWIAGPLIALCLLTDGSARWLLPVWPAIAMVGGICIASVSRERWGVFLQRGLYAGVIIIAGAQAWWYGFERARRHGDRSPRAFIGELLRPELSVQPQRMATLDFWSPALDLYVDHDVVPIGEVSSYPPHRPVMSLEALALGLRDNQGTITMLIRQGHPGEEGDLERLIGMGLAVQTIDLGPEWRIDDGETPVQAVRVWSP